MRDIYKTKCRRCKKIISVKFQYDYDTQEKHKDKMFEVCSRCREKNDKKWETKEAKEAAKYLVTVPEIKQLSSKKEFIKNYSTLERMGVEINPEDKNKKCRWCGGENMFRYVLNDWEYMYEILCVDCMEKIIKSVKKKYE